MVDREVSGRGVREVYWRYWYWFVRDERFERDICGTGNTMGIVQWQRDCEDSWMGMEQRDLLVLLVSDYK